MSLVAGVFCGIVLDVQPASQLACHTVISRLNPVPPNLLDKGSDSWSCNSHSNSICLYLCLQDTICDVRTRFYYIYNHGLSPGLQTENNPLTWEMHLPRMLTLGHMIKVSLPL